jgi:hypothetical protein
MPGFECSHKTSHMSVHTCQDVNSFVLGKQSVDSNNQEGKKWTINSVYFLEIEAPMREHELVSPLNLHIYNLIISLTLLLG